MSQLEQFQATVSHSPHPGYLFYMHFTEDLRRRLQLHLGLQPDQSLETYFGMYQPGVLTVDPPEVQNPDFSPYFRDVEIPPRAFINRLGVLEIPGSMYHFTKYVSPLRHADRLSDLEEFPYPQVVADDGGAMAKTVQQLHGAGRVAGCWVGHMYEDAWQVRGYEQFLMDMVTEPAWCEFILDRFMERNLAAARIAAKAGVDFLRTGDDVANQNSLMFSGSVWRRLIKPRWAKVYAEAKRIKPDIEIWYHSDGNIAEIIPELIEIGVTILNPVQPECLDPLDIKRKYGTRLVLDGTIGTQTTMPYGTVAEVKRVVQQRALELGEDGALILSPTHVLEPDVPLENIQALADAVHDL